MVINANVQLNSSPGNLGPGAASVNKPPVKHASSSTGAVSGEDNSVDFSARPAVDAPSSIEPILDTEGAAAITEFARFHILSNPAATVSVQANSRPDAVFELLDGILG